MARPPGQPIQGAYHFGDQGRIAQRQEQHPSAEFDPGRAGGKRPQHGKRVKHRTVPEHVVAVRTACHNQAVRFSSAQRHSVGPETSPPPNPPKVVPNVTWLIMPCPSRLPAPD